MQLTKYAESIMQKGGGGGGRAISRVLDYFALPSKNVLAAGSIIYSSGTLAPPAHAFAVSAAYTARSTLNRVAAAAY